MGLMSRSTKFLQKASDLGHVDNVTMRYDLHQTELIVSRYVSCNAKDIHTSNQAIGKQVAITVR
jgi:hypothetical protein